MGSDPCPGCGGKGDLDGGASYWQCGSHDRRGFFYQSDLCEARKQLAAETKRADDAEAECERWHSLCEKQQWAVGSLENKLTAAEQARDEAVREVDRLREDHDHRVAHKEAMQEEISILEGEVERLREENEQLRKGAPLGPIIGAQTILQQETELKRLRAALNWIVQPDTPIGSDAEFQHRAIEVAKLALLQPKEAGDGK